LNLERCSPNIERLSQNIVDRRRSNLILLNVCIGQTIVGLDQRALLVALPTLTEYFHTAFTTIRWTILAYDLVLLGLVITMGRLGDLFGRRRFYTAGFVLFVTGSALCIFSQSPGQLIAFRILQAIGGSMISANGRAIVSVAVPHAERGKALGLTSTAFHIGFLSGPTLGGFMIDTIGWRWIFSVNIPIGIWAAWLAWRVLQESRVEEQDSSIDFGGAFLLLLTNGLLIYSVDQIPHLGWHHPTVLTGLGLAAAACATLIFVERKARTPILLLSLFRSRLFTAGVLSLFLVAFSQVALNFLMPFYLQNLRGFSPSQVGWIIVADSVIIMAMAPVAGSLSDRLGSRLLCTTGCALIAFAQFLISTVALDSSVLRIIIPLGIQGFGWALFNSPNQSAILGAVPVDRVGSASGMVATAGRSGGAFGVALAATLFSSILSTAGLSQTQIETPQSWAAVADTVVVAFDRTVFIIALLSVLAAFFSAMRSKRERIP
jgi:EmrB/QacA subfamily drug resistance transporter